VNLRSSPLLTIAEQLLSTSDRSAFIVKSCKNDVDETGPTPGLLLGLLIVNKAQYNTINSACRLNVFACRDYSGGLPVHTSRLVGFYIKR